MTGHVDAEALCRGLGASWPDYLADADSRADMAKLRAALPGEALISGHGGRTLLHPELAPLVARWCRSRRPSSRGHVYLIRCCGRVKIGRSKDPDVRSRQFQTPYPPEVLCVVATADMARLEKMLHERYAGRRRYGEWFELTDDEVAEAAAAAAAHS